MLWLSCKNFPIHNFFFIISHKSCQIHSSSRHSLRVKQMQWATSLFLNKHEKPLKNVLAYHTLHQPSSYGLAFQNVPTESKIDLPYATPGVSIYRCLISTRKIITMINAALIWLLTSLPFIFVSAEGRPLKDMTKLAAIAIWKINILSALLKDLN